VPLAPHVFLRARPAVHDLLLPRELPVPVLPVCERRVPRVRLPGPRGLAGHLLLPERGRTAEPVRRVRVVPRAVLRELRRRGRAAGRGKTRERGSDSDPGATAHVKFVCI